MKPMIETARGLRIDAAAAYLGMNRNAFNLLVRPYVQEIRYSPQVIVFDKLDLDAWLESYKSRGNGMAQGERNTCENQKYLGCTNDVITESGTSTKSSTDTRFDLAVARAMKQRPKR